jgi:hypothetical protein
VKTATGYDVIVLSDGVTGWERRLLITHEDVSYHATLFHNQGDGYELIFRDIDYPEWAKDYDLMKLDDQTWGAVNE